MLLECEQGKNPSVVGGARSNNNLTGLKINASA